MLYGYLFVDSVGPTAGKEGSYINMLHVRTDYNCVCISFSSSQYVHIF